MIFRRVFYVGSGRFELPTSTMSTWQSLPDIPIQKNQDIRNLPDSKFVGNILLSYLFPTLFWQAPLFRLIDPVPNVLSGKGEYHLHPAAGMLERIALLLHDLTPPARCYIQRIFTIFQASGDRGVVPLDPANVVTNFEYFFWHYFTSTLARFRFFISSSRYSTSFTTCSL